MRKLVDNEAWVSVSLRRAMVVVLGSTLLGGAQAADLPDGQKLFKKYCTQCHSVRTLAPRLRNRHPADREDFLERLIASHHGPQDPVERKALVPYVSKAVGK